MRKADQAASGKAEEEPIAGLSATTTRPVAAWAPFRAAEDPPDTAQPRTRKDRDHAVLHV